MPLLSGGPPNNSSTQNLVHCGVNSVPPEKMPVMPVSASDVPRSSSAKQSDSMSLGVLNMTLYVVAGGEHGNRLIDAVLLIFFQVIHPALFDELDHPPRIEVDAKADAATVLRQVLHSQTQPPRATGAEHQPIAAGWEVGVG